MTKFVFRRFVECEYGRMARLETEKTGIPINIFAENDTDYDLQNCKNAMSRFMASLSRQV